MRDSLGSENSIGHYLSDRFGMFTLTRTDFTLHEVSTHADYDHYAPLSRNGHVIGEVSAKLSGRPERNRICQLNKSRNICAK